ATDQKGVAEAHKVFVADWAGHDEREERRLAYVGVTRPRRLLLCSGYWWGEGKRSRGPSGFLTEMRAACDAGAGVVDEWTPAPPDDAVNPTATDAVTATWPADPLGDRRAALDEAAALVRAALDEGPAPVRAALDEAAAPVRAALDEAAAPVEEATDDP